MRNTTTSPTLSIDVKLYQHYLDNADLTEEQKQELLQTLWQIICEFVQIGFNISPVEQAQYSSGKDGIIALTPSREDSPTLEYEQTLPNKFDDKGASP